METESDASLFDVGDDTALVCIDNEEFQKLVVPQLIDLSYKVNVALNEEDVLQKLRAYSYHVVVTYEHFKGSTFANNPVLKELGQRPGSDRRSHFVVLLTHRFATNDPMTAFALSVDQTINVADVLNLKPVLRRGVAQHREMYHSFHSMLKTARAM
jgi:CheY-like chemotaxis protein